MIDALKYYMQELEERTKQNSDVRREVSVKYKWLLCFWVQNVLCCLNGIFTFDHFSKDVQSV